MNGKIKILFWYTFLVIYLEFLYKIFALKSLFSINTLSTLLFSIPFIILFSCLSRIFNVKANKIITCVISIFLVFLFLVQLVYFNFYGSMLSLFSLSKGAGQVTQFIVEIVSVVGDIWYQIILFILPIILFLIFKNKIFSFNRIKRHSLYINMSVFFLSIFIISFLIWGNGKKDNEYLNLVENTHAPILTINKMGMLSTEFIDIERYIFGFEEKLDDFEIEIPVWEEEVEEEIIIEYNTLEIDFDNLILKEKNNNVKKMHNFFKNSTPSEKNEYTGMFEGKNLIFVTAEAFDTIALDPVLTPTLYKMANSSLVFNNYYQPIFPVSTSDGEYMNLTSLIPKEGVWSSYRSSSIKMPFALGNMFKALNYSTNGYHNGHYKYYDRHLSHPNMGFKWLACRNGLQKKMNCDRWPNSDVELIEGTYKDYMLSDKLFATYYMTISGHLEYNKYGNSMVKRHWDKVKDLDYTNPVKSYLATHIEFDQSMEKLLKHLEEAGKLEETLIVIAPDHYPYGLKTKELNERSEIDRDNKFEKNKTTLIIYNPNIERKEINKMASSIDIIPTVYNLFGLSFDSRLFMGRDLLSDSEGLVIFSDRSWISDKGKYNSTNSKFISFNNEEISEDYIEKMNKLVSQKFDISSLILTTNYYSKLGVK